MPATAWYVQNNCTQSFTLKPWFLIFSAYIFHFAKAIIIALSRWASNDKDAIKTTTDEDEQKNVTGEQKRTHANSKLSAQTSIKFTQRMKNFYRQKIKPIKTCITSNMGYKIFETIYIVIKIVSIICIFYLDIDQFVKFVGNHTTDSWRNYKCLCSILLESSNWIVFMTNFLSAIPLHMDEENILDNSDESVYDMLSILENNENLRPKTLKQWVVGNGAKYIYLVLIGLGFAVYMIILMFVIIMPSMFVYPAMWILFCLCFLLVGISYLLDSKYCEKCVVCLEAYFTAVMVVGSLILGVIYISLQGFALLYQPLAIINWYSGNLTYVESLMVVYQSRNAASYWNNLWGDKKSLLSVFVAFFG